MVFVKKLKIFHPFLLGKLGKKKVFGYILDRKKVFLDYKNKELKKSKNWHFCKVVSRWFWSKKFSNLLIIHEDNTNYTKTINHAC